MRAAKPTWPSNSWRTLGSRSRRLLCRLRPPSGLPTTTTTGCPGKAPTVSEPTTESISSAAVRMTIAGNGAAIDDNRPDPCPRQAPAIRGLRRGFIAHGPCQRVDSGSLGPTAPARRTPDCDGLPRHRVRRSGPRSHPHRATHGQPAQAAAHRRNRDRGDYGLLRAQRCALLGAIVGRMLGVGPLHRPGTAGKRADAARRSGRPSPAKGPEDTCGQHNPAHAFRPAAHGLCGSCRESRRQRHVLSGALRRVVPPAAAVGRGRGTEWVPACCGSSRLRQWYLVGAGLGTFHLRQFRPHDQHLLRRPFGEWICVDARTLLAPNGCGLAESQLFDEAGLIGRATQTLAVRARG